MGRTACRQRLSHSAPWNGWARKRPVTSQRSAGFIQETAERASASCDIQCCGIAFRTQAPVSAGQGTSLRQPARRSRQPDHDGHDAGVWSVAACCQDMGTLEDIGQRVTTVLHVHGNKDGPACSGPEADAGSSLRTPSGRGAHRRPAGMTFRHLKRFLHAITTAFLHGPVHGHRSSPRRVRQVCAIRGAFCAMPGCAPGCLAHCLEPTAQYLRRWDWPPVGQPRLGSRGQTRILRQRRASARVTARETNRLVQCDGISCHGWRGLSAGERRPLQRCWWTFPRVRRQCAAGVHVSGRAIRRPTVPTGRQRLVRMHGLRRQFLQRWNVQL